MKENEIHFLGNDRLPGQKSVLLRIKVKDEIKVFIYTEWQRDISSRLILTQSAKRPTNHARVLVLNRWQYIVQVVFTPIVRFWNRTPGWKSSKDGAQIASWFNVFVQFETCIPVKFSLKYKFIYYGSFWFSSYFREGFNWNNLLFSSLSPPFLNCKVQWWSQSG